MPFINKSAATKGSKDRKINGKCTNATNRGSRVWSVYFIHHHYYIGPVGIVLLTQLYYSYVSLRLFFYSIEHRAFYSIEQYMYIQTMTVTMAKQVKAKMNLSTGAPLPPSFLPYLFIILFIHSFIYLFSQITHKPAKMSSLHVGGRLQELRPYWPHWYIITAET